jgi:hypothetical protein
MRADVDMPMRSMAFFFTLSNCNLDQVVGLIDVYTRHTGYFVSHLLPRVLSHVLILPEHVSQMDPQQTVALIEHLEHHKSVMGSRC